MNDFNRLGIFINKHLGKFTKNEESSGEALLKKTNKENTTTAKYISKAKYEKGIAIITTNLIYQNDKWTILSLNISSENFKNVLAK